METISFLPITFQKLEFTTGLEIELGKSSEGKGKSLKTSGIHLNLQ